MAAGAAMTETITQTGRPIFSVCPHDCPDTCGMLSFVESGRLVRVQGNPDHPYTRGNLCRKVAHYEERVYSPDRVLYPQRRVGPKGEGLFERITWDEALDEIAQRWKEILAKSGPQSILPYSYAGTMGVLSMFACEGRMWNRMGVSKLDRTICSTAGQAGHTYTMGWPGGIDPEGFALSQCIIAWGTNLSSTNVHLMPFVREAQKRGATFIVIDAVRTRTANAADWFIQVRPGTDTALALGMMHVIFEEGLEDRDFLASHTVGETELRERAKEYPPERVAEITGVAAEDIIKLARVYATRQPSAIRLGYGLTRNSNGGMMARTITCLPAIIGAWGKPGSGLLLSSSSHFPWNKQAVMRPDLAPLRGEPGFGETPRHINMNQLGRALTEPLELPVQSMMIWNCNPAAVTPHNNLVRQGLAREDLFTVVHEQMMTDTARFADILLPATSQMEHLDLHFAYGHLYAQLNLPAIEPMGEAWPNLVLHHALARRMGYTEPCFNETEEVVCRMALDTPGMRSAGVTFDGLVETGFAKVRPGSEPFVPFADGTGFTTPSGKVELYSEQALADGHDPLPGYVPLTESRAGNESLWQRYPINLLTPAAHGFLNSSFANQSSLQKVEKEPRIWVHPSDADRRGIATGDWLRVWNDRGEVRLRAVVSDVVNEGVAWSPSLWWNRDSPGGSNVNALTSDELTDMGGGSVFHTNLVELAVGG